MLWSLDLEKRLNIVFSSQCCNLLIMRQLVSVLLEENFINFVHLWHKVPCIDTLCAVFYISTHCLLIRGPAVMSMCNSTKSRRKTMDDTMSLAR